jgi:serine/threonine-protein kinase
MTLKERWTLDALLGVGGMAAVYSATHRNGSRVAVKWLHPELALDKKMRERFAREGYIANKVEHPGVVRVLDDDVAEDGSLMLFMELLQGETLEARAQRSGKRLDVAETLRLTHALLDVLAAAHEAGVVHRDLKPENLFIKHNGKLKVLDFGIARLRELSGRSGATGSQSSLGTPAFMPPEQARGRWQEVDARSDLWAVGATMFTLIAGRPVHEAVTVNEQLLAAMTEPAPSLASIVPSVPAMVAAIVDRALAFKSEDRWPDARAMGAACADAYATVAGHPIPEGDAAAPDLDETLPLDEPSSVPRVPAATVKLSPATLTTGRPVASVVPSGPPSSPRRPPLRYASLAVVGAIAIASGVMALRSGRTAPPTPPNSAQLRDAQPAGATPADTPFTSTVSAAAREAPAASVMPAAPGSTTRRPPPPAVHAPAAPKPVRSAPARAAPPPTTDYLDQRR